MWKNCHWKILYNKYWKSYSTHKFFHSHTHTENHFRLLCYIHNKWVTFMTQRRSINSWWIELNWKMILIEFMHPKKRLWWNPKYPIYFYCDFEIINLFIVIWYILIQFIKSKCILWPDLRKLKSLPLQCKYDEALMNEKSNNGIYWI